MSADTDTDVVVKRTADIPTDPDFAETSAEFLAMCAKIGGSDLDDMADVDSDNLADEFIRLPGQLAYWSALTSTATNYLLKAERVLKANQAKLWLETRQKLSMDPTKGRCTEALVDATMMADPRWSTMHEEVERARIDLSRSKVRFEALRSKKEALSSFNALRRAELSANAFAT